MPTEQSVTVRPVVAQDRAAAATRAVLALAATLVALPWWESPLAAVLVVVLGVVYLAIGLARPYASSRTWVADLGGVPRSDAPVGPTAAAVGVGLALGALGGLLLLLLVVVLLWDGGGSESILLVPSVVVLGRALDRLLVTRAVRRWEREQGVVLGRRRAANRTGVELFHEPDVERMVAVPVGLTPQR